MNEHSNSERLQDLLADRALFGLTDDEQDELNRLTGGASLDESLDQTAAIAAFALRKKSDSPLPDSLKQKILDSFTGGLPEYSISSSLPMPADRGLTDEINRHPEKSSRMNRRELAAWMIAAASVAGLFIDRRSVWSLLQKKQSAAQARDALVRNETDVVGAAWVPTDDPSARGVTGDVVWSTKAQQGFIRVKGLTPNEPFIHQYQLWIFDQQRDERYPIDGGTFNVESKGADTVITMAPHLRVAHPTMFAVTIEKTGGVVVSKRERWLLVANVPV